MLKNLFELTYYYLLIKLKIDNIVLDLESICENPEHEIFIYCVLLGRFEMSKIFWIKGSVNVYN